MLTPTAITLQFQGGVDLGSRRNAARGICGRIVVTKLVRCQGRHDERMSRAQQVERSLGLGRARCIVVIHNLANLAHQLFYGQNQLLGDE